MGSTLSWLASSQNEFPEIVLEMRAEEQRNYNKIPVTHTLSGMGALKEALFARTGWEQFLFNTNNNMVVWFLIFQGTFILFFTAAAPM